MMRNRQFGLLAVVALAVVCLAWYPAPAHAASNANAECLQCHASDMGAAAAQTFDVGAVDYDTACRKCHDDSLVGTHPYHNATGNCGAACHPGWGDSLVSNLPRYLTEHGAFASAASVNTTSGLLHIIHAKPRWEQSVDTASSKCGSCHAAAACDACHEAPTDATHAAHAAGTAGATPWVGDTASGVVAGDQSMDSHAKSASVWCGTPGCHNTAGVAGSGAGLLDDSSHAAYPQYGYLDNVVTKTPASAWKVRYSTVYTAGQQVQSNTANSTLSLPFSGEQIVMVADRDPYRGIAEIRIDGVLRGTVDLYSDTTRNQVEVFTSPRLTPGAHTISVRVTGTKNAWARAAYVTVDQFKVYTLAPGSVAPECTSCHADKTTSNHGYDPVTHTATAGSGSVRILGTDFGAHACSECHASAEIGPIHTNGCTTCHPTAMRAARPWNGSCAANGCHTAGSAVPMHGGIDSAHTIGAKTCTAYGCHPGGTNVAAVHATEGCATCHSAGKTPTLNCTATGCHLNMNSHADATAVHASGITAGAVTFFDDGADHTNSEAGYAVDSWATCSMCHATTNLVSLHANDCSLCHFGPTPPRASFSAWNKSCQQGSCHPSYHDNASGGHDGYYNGGNSNCDDCHNDVGWGGWDAVATPGFCGGCHSLGADTTAPTTYSTLLPSYVGTASVGFWTTDVRAVKATYYRLDGGATSTVEGALLVAPPSAGTQSHTLEYWSMDWAGNSEALHVTGLFTVTADTTPPVTTSDAKSAYGGPATIRLTATDNATTYGVRATYFRFDDGPVVSGTVATMPQPASGVATHTISFWSEDYAGNTETTKTTTFTVTADTVAPTTTTNLQTLPKIYGQADLAGSTYLVIYLTPTDPTPSSGIAGIHVASPGTLLNFYGAGEAWWNGSAWQMTVFNFLADGNYGFTYWARDNSGNVESAKTTTIAVDVTRPVTTSNAASTYTGQATIQLSPSDAFSGVATTYYKDGYYGTVQTGTTVVIPAPATGTASHNLYWWSVDKAGNVESAKYKGISVTAAPADVTPPTGSIVVNAGASWTNTSTVNLTLSASDTGGSGLAQMQFSNDNSAWSAWQAYATSASWALSAGSGSKSVYVRYRDGSGNVSASASDTIGLDTAVPTTTCNAVQGTTYAGPQSFTLVPSDTGGSGLSGTWWQLDSTAGTWTSGTSIAVGAPSSGTASHTLYFYSRDNATNQESLKSVAFSVSAIPGATGTISLIYQSDDENGLFDGAAVGDWREYTITNARTAQTVASGRDDWMVGGWTGRTTLAEIPVTTDRYDVHLRWYDAYSYDADGPVGPATSDFQVWLLSAGQVVEIRDSVAYVADVSGPTGSMAVDNGAATATTISVSIDSTLTDPGSGMADMRVDPGSGTYGSWVAYTPALAATLPVGDGTKTVNVQYRDHAGNVTTLTDTILLNTSGQPHGSQTLGFTGSPQTFTVPAGVTSLIVDLYGGAGGGADGYAGGYGGAVQALVPVTPGQVLTVLVGGCPGDDTPIAGWPNGGSGDGGHGGSGGGSTSVWAGSALWLEAGGGGAADHAGSDGGAGGYQGFLPGGFQAGGAGGGAAGGGGWNGGSGCAVHDGGGDGGTSYIAYGTGTLAAGSSPGNGFACFTW